MGLSERRCVAAVLLALTLPAQGARFVSQTWQIELRPRCPEGEVSCEIVAVLATDLFDAFMERNDLWPGIE